MFNTGDIIEFSISEIKFYGEIVGVDTNGKLEVSRLKKTEQQEGRIWEFAADDEWSTIDPQYVVKHVSVPVGSSRQVVVSAWKEVGFRPGANGITFCRTEDEDLVTMPLYQGDDCDSDEGDEGVPSTNPNMFGYADDGFIVPDDEGEDFEFANPDDLDEEGAKFVRETHDAVHDFDEWCPTDKQGKAIKQYIQKLDHKASIETDNKRVAAGKPSLPTSKPPSSKRKR